MNLHLVNVSVNTQSTIQQSTYVAILLPYASEAHVFNVSIQDCNIIVNRNHQNLYAGSLIGYADNQAEVINVAVSGSSVNCALGTSQGYVAGLIGYVNGPVQIKNVHSNVTVQSDYVINSVSNLIGQINAQEYQESTIDTVITQLQVSVPSTSKISGLIYSSQQSQIKVSNIQNKIYGLSSFPEQIGGIQYETNENTIYDSIYTQSDTQQQLGLSSTDGNQGNATNVYAQASSIRDYSQPNDNSIVTLQLTIPTYQLYVLENQTIDCNSQNAQLSCARHAICQESQLGGIQTYYCSCNDYSLRYGNQCIKIKYEPEDESRINQISLGNQSFLGVAIGGGVLLVSMIFFNVVLMQYFRKRNTMVPNRVEKGGKPVKQQSGGNKLNIKPKQIQMQALEPQQPSLNSAKISQRFNFDTQTKGTSEESLKTLEANSTDKIINKLTNYLPKVESVPTQDINQQLDNPDDLLNKLTQQLTQNGDVQSTQKSIQQSNLVNTYINNAPSIRTDKGSSGNSIIDGQSVGSQQQQKRQVKKVVKKVVKKQK